MSDSDAAKIGDTETSWFTSKRETCIKELARLIVWGGIPAVDMFNATVIACQSKKESYGVIHTSEIYEEICSSGLFNLIGMGFINIPISITMAFELIKFMRIHLVETKAPPIHFTPRPAPIFLNLLANTIAIKLHGEFGRAINAQPFDKFKQTYTQGDVHICTARYPSNINAAILKHLAEVSPFGCNDVLTHIVNRHNIKIIAGLTSITMYCMVVECYSYYLNIVSSELPANAEPANAEPANAEPAEMPKLEELPTAKPAELAASVPVSVDIEAATDLLNLSKRPIRARRSVLNVCDS